MYGIIYMAVFGFVISVLGINIIDNPIKAIILIVMAAIGLHIGGLDK